MGEKQANDGAEGWAELLPLVCEVGEECIATKDYRNGEVPWRFVKIVLESPHRTNVASHQLDSDSEVSTDQENSEYFQKFYLQFAFKRDDETAGKFAFKKEENGSGKMTFARTDS